MSDTDESTVTLCKLTGFLGPVFRIEADDDRDFLKLVGPPQLVGCVGQEG